MRRTTTLLISMLLSAFSFAEVPNTPTHGTINILIGSRFGLVAETDTRLSHDGQSAGVGQKLFQVDDQTICTIADFYRDPGPPQPLKPGIYPFLTSIPNILSAYVGNAPGERKDNFKRKVDLISQAVALDLELLSIAQDILGEHSRRPSSTITVAGYDHDAIKVKRLTITAAGIRGGPRASIEAGEEVVLGRQLQSFTAGLDDVAKSMLSRSDSPYNSGSPSMKFYDIAKSAPDASLVNLDDLKYVEDKIEFETYRKYPREVGGEKEFAYLRAGHVEKISLPTVSKPEPTQYGINLVWGLKQSFPLGNYQGQRFMTVPGLLTIEVAAYEQNTRQALDDYIFTHSTFIGSTLTYNAEGIAILDGTNKLSDCVLELGKGVKRGDPFLREIVKRYPDLQLKWM